MATGHDKDRSPPWAGAGGEGMMAKWFWKYFLLAPVLLAILLGVMGIITVLIADR